MYFEKIIKEIVDSVLLTRGVNRFINFIRFKNIEIIEVNIHLLF